ncbi:hypothetical protein X777_02104 [Ooceraea biroi]|uniref:Uncharacterized protein n=1 Tax=Ooceraea biroi TaxID=2015173 RepID=A0A026WR36_OOCBI|nr:hypothetical protein X777_02104 [Ooceraea biroi]
MVAGGEEGGGGRQSRLGMYKQKKARPGGRGRARRDGERIRKQPGGTRM